MRSYLATVASLGVRTGDEADRELEKLKERLKKPEEREAKPEPVTITQACDDFLKDARARDLKQPTLDKYGLLFRRLQAFAEG